jgi:hypothetical protein
MENVIFGHSDTCHLAQINGPTLSVWAFHGEKYPAIEPVLRSGPKAGVKWWDLAQVKLLAAMNSLVRLGFPVKRANNVALTWSHTADATEIMGSVVINRPAGGVHPDAMTLCVVRPGEQFGTVIPVDPSRPFISVWKELLGSHDAIAIVDCDRVLGGVTERLTEI